MDEGWRPDGPREATATFGDSVLFEDRVDAKVATPLHALLLEAAEQASDRSAAAAASKQDPNEELKEACIAILAAAIAIETGTHWAAQTHHPPTLADIQDDELARKWASMVGRVTGVAPDLGKGIGHAVSQLALDRNRIAHNPSRGYEFFSRPRRASKGKSDTRTDFTAKRARRAVETAREALAMVRAASGR